MKLRIVESRDSNAIGLRLTFLSRGLSETVAMRRKPEAAPARARLRDMLPRTWRVASIATMVL